MFTPAFMWNVLYVRYILSMSSACANRYDDKMIRSPGITGLRGTKVLSFRFKIKSQYYSHSQRITAGKKHAYVKKSVHNSYNVRKAEKLWDAVIIIRETR